MSTKQFLNQTLHSKVQAGEVVLVVVVGGGCAWPQVACGFEAPWAC